MISLNLKATGGSGTHAKVAASGGELITEIQCLLIAKHIGKQIQKVLQKSEGSTQEIITQATRLRFVSVTQNINVIDPQKEEFGKQEGEQEKETMGSMMF